MPSIHSTAQISQQARLADDVIIGPFCILDGDISIGAGTHLKANVHIWGTVTIGEENTIHSNAVIGDSPQDLSFTPEINSEVIIGNRNTIRENATIHRGAKEGGVTRLGNNCLLMAGAHLGHDCTVHNNAILANNVMLAGYVEIGNNVFLGGGAGIHQFVRVGDFSLLQGNSGLTKDLPPYCVSYGINTLSGLNIIGLRRAGFSNVERKEIKHLYTTLFQSGKNTSEAIAIALESEWSEKAQLLLNAVASPTKRGFITR